MSTNLSRLRWPSLAQDLAVLSAPGSNLDLDNILKAYGVTNTELKQILVIPEFQSMFREEMNRVQSLGTRAGDIYRFSTLSQSLSEKLFRDAMASAMDAKDAIKLLELFCKAARLTDVKEAAQVNTQVNVGVSLPLPTGLENSKLAHLEAQACSAT